METPEDILDDDVLDQDDDKIDIGKERADELLDEDILGDADEDEDAAVENGDATRNEVQNGPEKPSKSPGKAEKEKAKAGTPSDESDLEEGEFEVEKILDVKMKDRKVKFLVRWKGYGSDEDSWEPEENLESALVVLSEYRAKNGDMVRKVEEKVSALSSKKGRRKGKPFSSRRSSTPANDTKQSPRRSRRGESPKEEDEEEGKSDSEQEEKKPKKAAERKNKKRKEESDEEEDEAPPADESHDEDDDFVPAKRGKRGGAEKKSQSTQQAAKPVLRVKTVEPIGKEPAPRKAKNAWLYEDGDDVASDDSDEGSTKKASKKDVDEKNEKENNEESAKQSKRGKRSAASLTKEEKEGSVEIAKRSRVVDKKRSESAEVKLKDKGKEAKEKEKEKEDDDEEEEKEIEVIKEKRKGPSKKAVEREAKREQLEKARESRKHKTQEVEENGEPLDATVVENAKEGAGNGKEMTSSSDSGVIFKGVVLYNDSQRVLYCKKNEPGRCRMVTVKEAHDLDSFGLVKYLMSRAEFTAPKVD